MQPKLFLEDIGEVVSSTSGKNVWKIRNLTSHEEFKDKNLPETIYVVDFPG